MNDNPVSPPDMLAAGMTQPQIPMANPFAGIAAIPSQPMQMPQLPNVPEQPMPMANPFAAALVGGLNPSAPNPLLNYQNQMQDNLRAEQWQKQQMQLRLMEMETKRQEAGLKISQEMLAHPDPAVKKAGAQGIAAYAKTINMPIAQSVVDAWGSGRLSPKDSTDIIGMLARDFTPEQIAKSYPGATPKDIVDLTETWKKIQSDPRALEAMGLPTADKIKLRALEVQSKELDIAHKQHPELALPFATEMTMLHRTQTGKEYSDGTEESRYQAYTLAKQHDLDQKFAQKSREIQLTEGLRAQAEIRRDAIAASRFDREHEILLKQKQQLITEKKDATLNAVETQLNIMDERAKEIIAGGFVPKDASQYARQIAMAKRGQGVGAINPLSKPNDPAWRAWLDMQPSQIGFARSIQNDVGMRAFAAFQQVMRVTEDPPTKEGLQQVLKQMRLQIQASRENRVIESKELKMKFYPDAKISAEGEAKPSPLAPEPPPGFTKVPQ